MDNFFKKIKIGVFNDHFDQLGGGTTHSFKIIEFLKRYYDTDVFIGKDIRDPAWMKTMMNLDTEGVKFHRYQRGIGKLYPYMFFNISHWKAEPTDAMKKFMIVFFPQFFFPLYDYHLIANSEYTKQHILNRWKKADNEVSVIYPPIQTSQFKSSDKKNIILHVSRLASPRPEADKAHLQMIQAFKAMKLKDWEFHIVGQPQDSDYVRILKNQAAGYKIIFHERAPFHYLQDMYAKAKIYWHMTGVSMPKEVGAQEHFGMSIVEAMAAGCVPVVFNSGGPREIIEDAKSGILVDSIEDLQKNTEILTRNRGLWEEMSNEAEIRARKFDEKEISKQFYSLITKGNKVSIIMICWNNSQFTRDAVKRLYEVTPPGFELILVDNGSTDDTPRLVEELAITHENVKFVHSKENLGFAGGNNLGLKQATGEYICFLNNDTLPQWGWLERMVDVLETNDKAGAVGARLYYGEKNGKWLIQHAGVKFDEGFIPKHIGRGQEDKSCPSVGIQEVEAVTGACMLVRKEFAEFNEEFVRGYYEDTDMCLRIREAGYKVYINHDARLIHYEGKSQDILKRQNTSAFNDISQRNKEKFQSIWKKKYATLPKIDKTVSVSIEGKKVEGVEVGGGERPLYPNYEQVDLRMLANVKHNNDARALPFPDNSVQHLVACYVLQCFTREEAQSVIAEWHRVLAPGGQLELYVPNVRLALSKLTQLNEEKWLDEIYGEQKHSLDYYKSAWTFDTLDRLLSQSHFVRATVTQPPRHRPDALGAIAYKTREI